MDDHAKWLRESAGQLIAGSMYGKKLTKAADALDAKDAEIKRLEAKLEVVPENERGRAWFGNEGLDCRTGRLVAAKCP